MPGGNAPIPTLPPAPSPMRLQRITLGLGLFHVAQAVRCSESVLSRLERGQLSNPALERRVLAWLAKQRRARA